VRDQQHRLPLARSEHVVHQVARGVGVEVRGGLVEDEHRSVREQRAGDEDPLPLRRNRSSRSSTLRLGWRNDLGCFHMACFIP